MMVVRRAHLYAGLFLLPWVFLYGITGAMFNHYDLLPEAKIESVPAGDASLKPMQRFPKPVELAEQIVAELRNSAGSVEIELADQPRVEFTNPLMFESKHPEGRRVVKIDPISGDAEIAVHPQLQEVPEPVLDVINQVQLESDPHDLALETARAILEPYSDGSSGDTVPLGWTKLNFLATVDGVPARITYVLKDGHVDVTRFTGEDGYSWRQYFLRLHTSHGQPPHWNARRLWSLVIDAMAIAMVIWGLSGLLMWWQIKRTRVIGGVVILLSLCTAAAFFFGMMDFYAATKL
ncbi:PepSY domain-containing protein [Rubinisphaera margarita]|uniref:PepSY domain-containing protein n=1 Tax=Rubinisphaera margarita TaxID=2909586 RepID=UPI001EE9998B|nr:PepSY domain-containing protein [Rubinisphaera margarita]MCG6158163.1 PepSY domain-containing protein [Rubinisphaera margarita]